MARKAPTEREQTQNEAGHAGLETLGGFGGQGGLLCQTDKLTAGFSGSVWQSGNLVTGVERRLEVWRGGADGRSEIGGAFGGAWGACGP